MDEGFGEMNCEFRSDSVVMRLLRAAMDKALRKVHSEDGLIERLIEGSKFYEFALIQMESSLKLIQEEEGIPESSREKLDSDLMEIQTLLGGRLERMHCSIVEMDRELMERLENELKLKQALEMKERELAHLNSCLEIERTKNEGLQEIVLRNQASGNETEEGNICELKNSVDQQVLNIKQKLEDERISLTSGTRKIDHGPSSLLDIRLASELLDHGSKEVEFYQDDMGSEINLPAYTLRPEQNIVIEQMSSDIDILKGTLDFAFGRMQNAEVLPLEKQWRCTIEQDTLLIGTKGFMRDHRQNFEAELRKRNDEVSVGFTNDHWLELIQDMTSLHCVFGVFDGQDEIQERVVRANETFASSPHICRTSSEPLPEVDFTEELPEEGSESDRRPYAAKLIKYHESIIRKQQEGLQALKAKVSQSNGYLPDRRDSDSDGLERRVQNVIVKLDNVLKKNNELCNKKLVYKLDDFDEKSKTVLEIADEERIIIDNDAKVKKEIRMLTQESDDSSLQTAIMEEIYGILLHGLFEKISFDSYNYVTESFENKILAIDMREEIYYIICNEAVKDFGYNHELSLIDGYENFRNETITRDDVSYDSLVHYFESTIREDVNGVYFQEMVEEWNKQETIGSLLKEDVYMVFFRDMIQAWEREREAYKVENLIREDVYKFLVLEAVKDTHFSFRGHEILHRLDSESNVSREESLIQKLNSLLQEMEEDMMLREDYEQKECSRPHDLMVSESAEMDECNTTDMLMAEDETSFYSVSCKLEKALQYLSICSAILREFAYADDLTTNPISGVVHDGGQPFCQPKENQVVQLNSSGSVLSPLNVFLQVLEDFECTAYGKLELHCSRMEELEHRLDPIIPFGASIQRKEELLYKKAFFIRCHNLQLAEVEVDMLGDQVDKLLGLLVEIYLILDRYSGILSPYFDVSGILKLIKKELNGCAAPTRNL